MENKEFLTELKNIKNDNELNCGVNVSLYDFVASNYWKMSKEQLKELILNLDYAIYNKNTNLLLEMENYAIMETIERFEE